MKLSIIVPVFNEGKSISEILTKLMAVSIKPFDVEIIVVDDGSTDETKKKLSLYKTENINVLIHDKNLGKGSAVRTGIKTATGDYVLIQDADLEYDPKYISTLLSPILNNNARVVYGTRLKRLPRLHNEEKKMLFLIHFIGNRMLSLLTSVLYGQWITDMETCYKVFPRKAVAGMKLHAKGFEFEPEITAKLLKAGYRIVEVPITTVPRGYDEGKKLHTIRDGFKALVTLLKYRFVN